MLYWQLKSNKLYAYSYKYAVYCKKTTDHYFFDFI